MNPFRFAYAKAIYAGVIALLGALAAAVTDDEITGSEWIAAVIAAVAAVGAVYGVTGTEPTSGDNADG